MAKTIKFYKAEDSFGFFSNYSNHPILIDGIIWKTAEHYYQGQKHEDQKIINDIKDAETSAKASKIGRLHNEKIKKNWNEIKDAIMEKVIRAKVEQYEEIKKELIATKDNLIIENSPVDYYWGCGEDKSGLNKLGKLWMKIRKELE